MEKSLCKKHSLIWECDCGSEGIMMSYEDDFKEGIPSVYLAFFENRFISFP